MIELSIAGVALVVALVLTVLAAPQLEAARNARRAARHPEPVVDLPPAPLAAAPMDRRYLAPNWAAMAAAKRGGAS
jgi:hypothetical protein